MKVTAKYILFNNCVNRLHTCIKEGNVCVCVNFWILERLCAKRANNWRLLQNSNITKINLERCFSQLCKTTASSDFPSMFTMEGCDHSLVCKRPFFFLQSYVLATSGGFVEDK